MIPVGSKFPEAFDDDTNLYLVKDYLRLRLAEDYNPGDVSITVEGDLAKMAIWPQIGLITLTEQCSDIDKRAISFYYNGIVINDDATGTFSNLEILPGFSDVVKMKKITNVTQNVMAAHHNQIKDAVINIQEFAGVKGTIDAVPFGETLEGRINFLRKLVLVPKAWFTANKRIGVVPFEVEFNELSFKLGTDTTDEPTILTWDFGDNTTSQVSIISVTTDVPSDAIDVIVYDEDQGKVKKTYMSPGIYGVKLNIKNEFGEDECYFPDFITARVEAPKEAIIRIRPNSESQTETQGSPVDGPFVTFPKVRSPINTLISFEIDSGENPNQIGYSYAGELLDANKQPVDPINNYTWSFGDDLEHANSKLAKASYSVGGIYDLKLRVDTEFGAYRISTYEDCVDVVENVNLWMWIYDTSTTVRAYEFGLISQTFKLTPAATQVVNRNSSFLNNKPNSIQQKREFNKNVGIVPRSTIPSGKKGTSIIYYATGRSVNDTVANEAINLVEFNGFLGTYVSRTPITRPWNWVAFNSPSSTYFILGGKNIYPPNSSPTNVNQQQLNLNVLTVNELTMAPIDFGNASELQQNVVEYNSSGESIHGNFSVYRSTWKDTTGWLARNDGIGPFFRIKSFYKTEGTLGSPFQTFKKMQDIQGPTRLEGELVTLIDGIYFFNNTGSVSRFDDTTSQWFATGPGLNSAAFRIFQDSNYEDFDNGANTLIAASDQDRRAYLSFDYTNNSFIKFDQITRTFSSLGSRPIGQQFLMGVY